MHNNFRPYVSILGVIYALESPWPCDELELGPSSRRCFLPSFFCDAALGIRVPGLAFSSIQFLSIDAVGSFLSIDAVGSEILTALHEYIDCGTHQRAPSDSFIKLVSVRVLGFPGRLFVE